MAEKMTQARKALLEYLLNPRRYLPLLLVIGSAIFASLVILSGQSPARIFSIIGFPMAGLLLLSYYDKTFFLLVLALYLPFTLYITAIPNLAIYEVLVLLLFFITLIRLILVENLRLKEKVVPIPVKLYFAIGLLSYIMHPSLPTQLFRSVSLADTSNFRAYWGFFLGLLVYFSVPYLIGNDKKKLLRIIKILVVISVVVILINLTMVCLGISTLPGFTRTAWMVSRTGRGALRAGSLGVFGAMLFMLLLSFRLTEWFKKVKPILFSLSILAILLSGGRMVFLAIFATFGLYLLLKREFIPLVVIFCLVFSIILFQSVAPHMMTRIPAPFQRTFTILPSVGDYGPSGAVMSAQGRLEIWKFGFEETKKHPFLGRGFLSMLKFGREIIFSETRSEFYAKVGSHGAYIGTAVTLGVPALLLFIWIIWLHYKKALFLFRQKNDSFLKAFSFWLLLMLFYSALAFTFQGNPFTMVKFFFILGLINMNWIFYKKEIGAKERIK